MNQQKPNTQEDSEQVIASPNSGAYAPGPIKEGETDFPSAELWEVQSSRLDLAIEEFPEGPYGATTNEERLGKVSPWEPGQAVSGRFRDSNMIRSDRRVAVDEPNFKQPPGTVEGQTQ